MHARKHTVQPASEAMGPNFLLIEPPALKRAMSTPLKLHGVNSHGDKAYLPEVCIWPKTHVCISACVNMQYTNALHILDWSMEYVHDSMSCTERGISCIALNRM